MKLKPIKTKKDYEESLKNFGILKNAPLDTDESDLAEILAIMIQDWEAKNINNSEIEFDWTIDYIFDLVNLACLQESEVTLTEKGLKLSEEVGELSAEILKVAGVKYSNLSVDQLRNNILLESCDVLIMTLSIMNEMKFTKQEIVEMTKSQIEKWEKLPKRLKKNNI